MNLMKMLDILKPKKLRDLKTFKNNSRAYKTLNFDISLLNQTII